ILAYEKALGSLQYGPGIAIAFSVAPLMAILIWLLARFMRQDDKRDGSSTRGPGLTDRLLAVSVRLANILIDLVFLPIQLVFAVVEWLVRRVRVASGRPATQPILRKSARSNAGPVARLLVLVPFLGFVIFPFYWIVTTSLKSTPQISERRSIFWPDPPTMEQYSSLLQDT